MSLVPAKMKPEAERIAAISDKSKLFDEIRSILSTTLECVIRWALLVRRADELKIEIPRELQTLPFQYIRKIAYEQVLPELFVALQGDEKLLQKAACLPIPDQRLLAENKPLKVMESDGDFRMIPPLSMNLREIQQVFGKGKIRGDEEQLAVIREKASKAKLSPELSPSEIRLDRKRGGIVVEGKRFISAAELSQYLGQLARK